MHIVGPLLLALCLMAPAVAAHAQTDDEEGEPQRIESVTFPGAESLAESDLRASIETQETSCLSFLLRPFCALGDWSILRDVHYLDREAVREDEIRLRIHYYQRGFRAARVESEVRPNEDGVDVVFAVEEGPATRIEAWSLNQRGDVLSDRRIRRAMLPSEGDRLDLIRIAEGLADLAMAYGEAGYLDAELRDSIAVAPGGLRARVSIELEPGPRSTLEALDVEGNSRVSEGAIANALRLRQGRVLRTNDLAASQRSLYESNLFHEARVRVPEQADSAKRVQVTVREAPPRAARLGGGFNSVDFGQVEGQFTNYDFLGGSRRLDMRVTVGNLLAGQLNGATLFQDVLPRGPVAVDADEFLQPTWQASAEFRQPTFLSAANVVGFSVFGHRRTIPGIAVDEGYGGEVSITRRFDFPTPVTAAYRYERSTVLAGDLYFCVNYGICEPVTIDALRAPHGISPVSLSLVDNRADDPVAPSTGYRVRVDLEHASKVTASDFAYQRISAAGAYYMPLDLHRQRVLAGRLRVGWVRPLAGTAEAIGLDFEGDLLHPRKRFYAGGSRSVRGYHENQLGPRVLTVDPNALIETGGCTEAEIAAASCDPSGVPVTEFHPRPVGGHSLVEANVEYRFPVNKSMQGAIFVDGAVIGGGLREFLRHGSRAVTPGFGARWGSPVGPIRVDLGIRPLVAESLPVVTQYEDEEGLLRIVRLEEPLAYDPLGDSPTFLDQVLGRLVLHLSIGEAF